MHILHFDSMLIQWKRRFHWTVTLKPGLNSCNQLKMAEMMEAITVKSNQYISVVIIKDCSLKPPILLGLKLTTKKWSRTKETEMVFYSEKQ